jgi:hypothetical protein
MVVTENMPEPGYRKTARAKEALASYIIIKDGHQKARATLSDRLGYIKHG